MALLKNIETVWGLSAPGAYHRVENLLIVNKDRIKFNVRSYSGNNIEIPWFFEFVIESDYDLDGPNPIKQAYLHLKTLPEFADAIDC